MGPPHLPFDLFFHVNDADTSPCLPGPFGNSYAFMKNSLAGDSPNCMSHTADPEPSARIMAEFSASHPFAVDQIVLLRVLQAICLSFEALE